MGTVVSADKVVPLRPEKNDIESGPLLQALPAAVYTTDAGGRITFYNEAAAALWGC
jgi:transcriptional regulator of aromatic amino acid metabolism